MTVEQIQDPETKTPASARSGWSAWLGPMILLLVVLGALVMRNRPWNSDSGGN